MRLVKNKTTKAAFNLESANIISIAAGQLSTGTNGFRLVALEKPGVGFVLAEYSEIGHAETDCELVINQWRGLGVADMLEIEDKVKESLLVMPDSVKNTSQNPVNIG